MAALFTLFQTDVIEQSAVVNIITGSFMLGQGEG